MKSWVAKNGCKKGLHANAFGDEAKTKTKPLNSHLVQKFPPISKDEKVFMKGPFDHSDSKLYFQVQF